MKIKATGLLLAMAMLVGIAALPAAAAVSVGPRAGVFVATAQVGKTGTCLQDGTGTVSGGGIGLLPELPPNQGKNAWYTISNGAVTDITGTGIANLCGRLTEPLDNMTPLDLKARGLGATCLATKGWDGKGKAVIGGTDVWLTNIGWKATVGGTFLVNGDAGGQSKKKADLLVAVVQALSEGAVLGCLDKTLGNKSGSQPFTVVAAYIILPGLGGNVPKKAPKK